MMMKHYDKIVKCEVDVEKSHDKVAKCELYWRVKIRWFEYDFTTWFGCDFTTQKNYIVWTSTKSKLYVREEKVLMPWKNHAIWIDFTMWFGCDFTIWKNRIVWTGT